MALDGSYTGLQASVADFLQRKDLTAAIPDFITLAEAQMNLKIRSREMWFLKTLTLTQETVKLPCDFIDIQSFRLNQNDGSPDGGKLSYRTPQQMDALPVGVCGTPRHYTIAGGCFVFWPIPGVPTNGAPPFMARVRGLERICRLSATDPSNWLLTKYPHAYLYGSLLQSAPYLKADERITVWEGLFTDAIDGINTADLNMIGDNLQTVSGIGDQGRHGHGQYGYNSY